MASLDVTFAERLRDLLKRAGLTQAELARKAEVDQSSISRYLRGECEPNLRQLRAIARGLKVSPTEFLVEGPEGEIFAVAAGRGKWLFFCDGALVGEWRDVPLGTVLHLKTVEATDGIGKKLLEGARKGKRRRAWHG